MSGPLWQRSGEPYQQSWIKMKSKEKDDIAVR